MSWTVIYRTGGTANFEWHRILERGTFEEMLPHRDEIRRGGRLAFVHELLDDTYTLPTEYSFRGAEPSEYVITAANGHVYVSEVIYTPTRRVGGVFYTAFLSEATKLDLASALAVRTFGEKLGRAYRIVPLTDL